MAAIQSRPVAFSAGAAVLIATSSGALAQKKYDPGANDTEIKIGTLGTSLAPRWVTEQASVMICS